MFTGAGEIFSWKSKEFSEESFKTLVTPDNSFPPKMAFIYSGSVGAKFKGNCLIQDMYILYSQKCKIFYCLRTRCMVKGFKHRFYSS